MSYVHKKHDYREAQEIAGAAIHVSKRRQLLQRCRDLLRQLDPNKPPSPLLSNEFRWQYLAFRERVHVYSEWLETFDERTPESDVALHKAEIAVVRSLHYFRDVLQQKPHDDDDGFEDDD